MSSIDERVVQMKFDNAQFERGVKDTTSSLEKLKKGLSLDGAKNGLRNLANAGKNFTLGGIGSAVEGIAGKFTNLGIVGVTALANIANRAVNAGVTLGKSLTIDPIMQGFGEYETKMGSIQTILANTARHGTTLDDVSGALGELNEYADKTIYNFADMTKNIGLFTNAGIDVGPATSMIKGFSNAAAASGTTSQGASNAAYQLSQAMSAGTIRLMDWRSLTNVGMGNKNMQEGILDIADAMGTFEGTGIDATTAGKDFNGSLEKGWLSADVMSSYLQIMAGDMDAAGMAALGLSEDQIKSFQTQQKTAEEAATKVRTFTQLVGTLQEAVGSGWAQTFELLFGDFNQATELFTNVSDTLGTMIGGMSDSRNKLLGDFVKFGGRDNMIKGLGNAFEALMAIIKPIGEAFRQIFPPTTGFQLKQLSRLFLLFTDGLIIGKDTAELVKRTFAGFFAVLGIGWEIVKAGIGMLFDLFGVVQDGSGGFLEITAGIGDFLVALHKAIKEGDGAAKVFGILGGIIKTIMGIVGGAVAVLVGFGKAIAGVFKGDAFKMDLGGFNPLSGILDKIIGRFEQFGPVIDKAVGAAKAFGSIISQVWGVLTKGDFTGGFLDEDSPMIDILFKIRGGLEQFWEWLKDFFAGFDFSTMLDMINTGLFAGLLLIFSGGIEDLKGMFGGGEGGFLSSLTDIFDGVTGSLEAMQTSLKADTLIKIAGAIALLAAAVLVISLIDSEDLTRSLVAISTMFIQLGAAMKVFEGIASGPGIVKMPLLAASMILLAVAINILALAVRQMSGLSWEELAKGLLGVGGALLLLAGWAKLMDKQSGPLLRASLAMIVVGAAVHILAGAVKKFSGMSWEDMLQGLAGVGGVLLAVAAFGRIGGGGTLKGAISMAIVGGALHILIGPLKKLGELDQDVLIQGLIGIAGAMLVMAGGLSAMSGSIAGAASLVVASAALWILVPLLVTLGEMSWNEIGKAATMLAGSLLIIAGGMYLMTGIIAGAASMLVAVAALWVLVPLLVELGSMSWNEIGKAATILAGSLLIIAGGMYLMTGALPGAAALIVVAAALRIFTPVLMALSTLSWNELLVGLAALAGVFVVLGVAGLLLTPVVPTLLLLGAAVMLLGLGAGLAGAGMLAFALGFTALGAAAAINGVIIIQLVKDLIGLIPYAAEQVGLGIITLAQVIIAAQPVWIEAIVTVIQALLAAIRELAPDIVNTVMELIMLLVDTIVTYVPVLVEKGLELLLGLLRGIRDNIQEVVEVGLEIIENFIKGVENGLPSLVDSAYNAMITFIDELAATIENNQARMERVSRRLAEAIINALIGGIGAFIGGVRDTWRNKVSEAITNAKSAVVSRAKTLASDIINGLKDKLSNMARVATTIKNKVAKSISDAKTYVVGRAKNLAGDIISGMVKGLGDGAWKIANAARDAAGNALNAAMERLGINSPSKEFMKLGRWSSEGLANGITEYGNLVSKASSDVGGTALDAMKKSISNIDNVISDGMDGDPTIRPVLDLSAIKRDAGRINGMLGSQALSAGSTFAQASSISAMANTEGLGVNADISGMAMAGAGMTFIQNNTSPVALNPVDIYRNTNNQLSAAKGALSRNVNIYSAQGRG